MLSRFFLGDIILVTSLFGHLPGIDNQEEKEIDTTSFIKQEITVNHDAPNEADNAISIDKEYLMGKFDYERDTAFIQISSRHGLEHIYIRKEVYHAFKKMYDAALEDNIRLEIISGTRSFDHQKYIWEAKWRGKREVNGKNLFRAIPQGYNRAKTILKYSSMPGTSRHHWGTDIDLNSVNNKYFDTTEGKKVFNWLQQNASFYGFHRPYNTKGERRPSGYNEEKWHWSYIPSAKLFLQAYLKTITCEDIKGFAGHELANKLQVISNYVEGINTRCKGNYQESMSKLENKKLNTNFDTLGVKRKLSISRLVHPKDFRNKTNSFSLN